jgi:chromosome segregation ATPase
MRSLPRLVHLSILVVSALVLAGHNGAPAYAQTARSGGNNATAQLMQQMQQLASERTSLQAQNARLKKDLEDMREQRDSLKASQQAVDARIKSSAAVVAQGAAQRDQIERQAQQSKEKLDQLVGKFRETIATLRQVESEKTTSQDQLSQRDRELKVCIDRNTALYNLNGEILTRFEHQSTWSRVAAAEPFTRIKRTQNENLVDDYKNKADDQRLTPDSVKAAAKRAPPSPPAPPQQPH